MHHEHYAAIGLQSEIARREHADNCPYGPVDEAPVLVEVPRQAYAHAFGENHFVIVGFGVPHPNTFLQQLIEIVVGIKWMWR